MLDLKQDEGGVTIKVRVQPKASKNETAGFLDGALKIRLTAPPVDGAANKACIEFMARLLGVPKSRVAIVQGHTGRNKTIRVAGLTPAEVRARLGG